VTSEHRLNYLAIFSIESELRRDLTTQISFTSLLFSNLGGSCSEYSTTDSATSEFPYHNLEHLIRFFKYKLVDINLKCIFCAFSSGKNKEF
jgi:hypothetical protein